jgi:phosphate transport system substrate-binding protein
MLNLKSRRIFAALVAATMFASMVAPAAAQAFTLKLSGSTTVQPVATKLAAKYKSLTGNTVTVTGGGSSVGVNDVLAGRVDIGMSSRDLKSSEVNKGAVTTAFARDALCVVVNPKNGVSGLTGEQIKSIYTGKITNWKQVGGANARIVLSGRTAASGTYEYFKESFLGGSRQSRTTRQYASNGMVRSAVANNKYAIGYVGMAFVNKSVKAVKVDGVAPTRTNALNGTYRHVRYLYWVTKGAPDGDAKTFINWTKSAAAQKIVATEYLKLH